MVMVFMTYKAADTGIVSTDIETDNVDGTKVSDLIERFVFKAKRDGILGKQAAISAGAIELGGADYPLAHSIGELGLQDCEEINIMGQAKGGAQRKAGRQDRDAAGMRVLMLKKTTDKPTQYHQDKLVYLNRMCPICGAISRKRLLGYGGGTDTTYQKAHGLMRVGCDKTECMICRDDAGNAQNFCWNCVEPWNGLDMSKHVCVDEDTGARSAGTGYYTCLLPQAPPLNRAKVIDLTRKFNRMLRKQKLHGTGR